MLRLGFAEVDITPDRPVELVGFHRKDNRSKGVLKPLLAQTAVFEADERCCLVTVDSIGFTKELTDGLRERVCRILDVAPEKVMVCFSHTHAAPEADFEREYYEETCRRICRILRKVTGKPDLPIVIATTTPTMHGDHGDILLYNDILKKVAAEENAAVNDLYSVVAPAKERMIGEDRIHLTPEGIEAVSSQTADIIRALLR